MQRWALSLFLLLLASVGGNGMTIEAMQTVSVAVAMGIVGVTGAEIEP